MPSLSHGSSKGGFGRTSRTLTNPAEDEVRRLVEAIEAARDHWRSTRAAMDSLCDSCTPSPAYQAAEEANDEACGGVLDAERELIAWLDAQNMAAVALDGVLYVRAVDADDAEHQIDPTAPETFRCRIWAVPLAKIGGVRPAPLKARPVLAAASC